MNIQFTAHSSSDIPAARMPTACSLKTCNICGIVLCDKTAGHFIVTRPKLTCAIIMLINQHLDMSHLSGGWIVLAKEKCSLSWTKSERNKFLVPNKVLNLWILWKMGAKQKCYISCLFVSWLLCICDGKHASHELMEGVVVCCCRQRDGSLRGVSAGQPPAPSLQGGWPRPETGHPQTAEGVHQPQREQSSKSDCEENVFLFASCRLSSLYLGI